MMENRSFDHMLGSLKAVNPQIDGIDPTFINPDANGNPVGNPNRDSNEYPDALADSVIHADAHGHPDARPDGGFLQADLVSIAVQEEIDATQAGGLANQQEQLS